MNNLEHKWSVVDEKLVRSYNFSTFSAAIAFVTDVGRISEIENHHPSILVEYTTVTLTCVTHDKGNAITYLDHRLAAKIDNNYIL